MLKKRRRECSDRDQWSMGLNKTEKKSEKKTKHENIEPEIKHMKMCPQCQAVLYDGNETCPLCHCVPEDLSAEDEARVTKEFGAVAPYPDAKKKYRAVKIVLRIALFVLILAAAAMLIVNYTVTPTIKWSFIAIAGEAYAYIMLNYWLKNDSGFAAKVALQIFSTAALVYAVDMLTGNYGWALQWAIPGIILLGDGFVFLLMMMNRSRWHSYLLLLILMGVCSIALAGFFIAGHLEHKLVAMICIAVTGIYILATVIFGQAKISTELKRRFHV